MSNHACELYPSALGMRNGRAPYFSHKPRASPAPACTNDRAYEAPSVRVTPRETRKPTTSKPPRRPVSCAPSPPVDAHPFPSSPSHRTLYSYITPPGGASPDSTPRPVLERSSSLSSPILHRDDGSTWRLVERVTEVFIVDVAPAPTCPPPPPPPLHRASSAPMCSDPSSRLDALDDPDGTPRGPPARVPRARTPSRYPSPDPTPLSPRLAALAHTLRTLDDAERARHRASAAPVLVPRSPRTTSMSGAELALELGLRLEGLGTLFPGGVPRALGRDEEDGDDDESWLDGQPLKSVWSLTSDEGGVETQGGSEYGEAEEGGACEADDSGTPSGSSSSSTDDDESRRDSWQSEATTVSAHSTKGAARREAVEREAVEREAEQACRRWRAWGAS
ncbi:hypothetical protein JCM9279_001574 [Rhodotorula babjevae]